MDYDEFLNMKADLELEGYTRYMNPIDAEIALEVPCDNCGSTEHLEAVGLRKDGDRLSYRAFSICHNCNTVVEF